MNKFIQTIKTALVTFMNKKNEAFETIQRMKKEYLPESVDKKTVALNQELANLRWKCRSEIEQAIKDGKASAEEWARLKGSDLTDDTKLLQAGIELTQTDFDDLCNRYKNNGSMCRLLGEYAAKRNSNLPELPEAAGIVLLTDKLWTLDKKLDKWTRIESTAYTLLERMYAAGEAVDSLIKESVNMFGEGWEV